MVDRQCTFGGQGSGVGPFGHRGILVEQAVQLLEGGSRRLQGVEELAELLDRLEQVLQVEDEGGDRADGDRLVAVQPATEEQNAGDGSALGQLDHREVGRCDALGLEVGGELLLVHRGESARRRRLLGERLHDAHARQAFLQRGERVADPVAQHEIGPVRLASEPHRRLHDEWGDHERDQGELPAQRHHHDQRTGEDQGVDDEHRQALAHQLLQRLDVGGHAGHEHAGAVAVEELHRQLLGVAEDLVAQIAQEPLTDATDERDRRPAGQIGTDGGQHVQHRSEVEGGRVARAHPLVDAEPDDRRTRQDQCRLHHDHHRHDGDDATVGAEPAPRAPGHPATLVGGELLLGGRHHPHQAPPPVWLAPSSARARISR